MKLEIKQRIEQIHQSEIPEAYKKTKAGIGCVSGWMLRPIYTVYRWDQKEIHCDSFLYDQCI